MASHRLAPAASVYAPQQAPAQAAAAPAAAAAAQQQEQQQQAGPVTARAPAEGASGSGGTLTKWLLIGGLCIIGVLVVILGAVLYNTYNSVEVLKGQAKTTVTADSVAQQLQPVVAAQHQTDTQLRQLLQHTRLLTNAVQDMNQASAAAAVPLPAAAPAPAHAPAPVPAPALPFGGGGGASTSIAVAANPLETVV